jgi:hypothetical protein
MHERICAGVEGGRRTASKSCNRLLLALSVISCVLMAFAAGCAAITLCTQVEVGVGGQMKLA